ncbi:hypothetical protein [Lysobacter fragariae]
MALGCVVLACALLAGCGQRQPPHVTITSATFGVFWTPARGSTRFIPTDVVPFAVGQRYGWLIHVHPAQARIQWREELTLPAAPATWGVERIGRREASTDPRTVVTQREVGAASGVIVNAWQIEPGDPRGDYTIKVTVAKGPSRTFHFQVR